MALLPYLHRIVTKQNLSLEDARGAMHALLSGAANPVLTAAFLAALRTKGETADELAGFALAMRDTGVPVPLDGSKGPVMDTCGTGGDGAHTFNISTAAAFVVAGTGLRVAKHGNRAISSRCGSADVLEALGIRLLRSPLLAARAIDEVGIGFLFAPAFHPAMKHVMPARLELKMRTAFNLLGPLANPARASHQLIGAPGVAEARIMAEALSRLPVERAIVVHGADGLDEVTTTGSTLVLEATGGASQHSPSAIPSTQQNFATPVRAWHFQPADLDIPPAKPEDLAGGDAQQNATILSSVLEGESGPRRDIVLLNAAFGLYASQQCSTLVSAWDAACTSLDSGRALQRLLALRDFCAEHQEESAG